MSPAWVAICISAGGFLLTIFTTVSIVSRRVGNWEQEQKDLRKDTEHLFGRDRERKDEHKELSDKFTKFQIKIAAKLGINGDS